MESCVVECFCLGYEGWCKVTNMQYSPRFTNVLELVRILTIFKIKKISVCQNFDFSMGMLNPSILKENNFLKLCFI